MMNNQYIPKWKFPLLQKRLIETLDSMLDVDVDPSDESITYDGLNFNVVLSRYDNTSYFNLKRNTLYVHLKDIDSETLLAIRLKSAVRYLKSLPF